MPVYTIPNNRTLIDLLRNGTNPLVNKPVQPIGETINRTIQALESAVPIPAESYAVVPVKPFLNATLLPTATQILGPLFTNATDPTATATGTGVYASSLSTATASSFPIGITNLTANAHPYPGAYHYNPAVEDKIYHRAPIPPLHPHIPSYLGHQDHPSSTGGGLSAMGNSVREFVKRTADTAGSPTFLSAHIGIFLSALLALCILITGLWYLHVTFNKRPRLAAQMETDGVPSGEHSEKSSPSEGRAWYTRFGFSRNDGKRWYQRRTAPVPSAGHIGSVRNAEEGQGGLRAAMGGTWNGGERNSWETQRTGPPAYARNGGLMDEKR